MKKLTALFLAMLMIFVVAGCKKETKEAATKKTDATPAPTATATPEATETPADAEAATDETLAPSEGETANLEAAGSEEKTAPASEETAKEQTAPADAGVSADTAVSSNTAGNSGTTVVFTAPETTEAAPKGTASSVTAVTAESLVGTYNLTALEMDGRVAPLQGESPLTVVLNGDGTGTYGPDGQAISINWTYENNSVVLTSPGKETPLTLLVQDGNLVQQGADGNAIYTK